MQTAKLPWPGDEGEKRWQQAWMAIKKVWASKWNERAYMLSILNSYGEHGYWLEAQKMFEKMVKVGVEPDIIVYGALKNALAEVGCLEEVVC